MTELSAQVERFYRDLWDKHDKAAIPEVLNEDFTFRGSLGQEKKGHIGFAEYVDMVHEALSGYKCIIDAIVVEPSKAFARMTFAGVHAGDFMGYSPSGKKVRWVGCALFTFRGVKIADVWVLGDLESIEAQLIENGT